MRFLTSKSGWIAGMLLGGAVLLLAQEWQAVTELAGVDFGGLTSARKAIALKALHKQECSCGCDMKVAECRVKDPNCTYSRGLASLTVGAIKAGQNGAAANAESKATKSSSRPTPTLTDSSDPIPTLR